MCGIAGFSGRFDKAWLFEAAAMLAHRGPDDAGTWADEAAGIGLAHTRLAILDLSPAGHKPMTDATGRFTIVYNGELYNFRELRAELESAGARFRSRSDTEVLLELFARHGGGGACQAEWYFRFRGLGPV
jgi:asparagine synthase (glutamine-hydrolysing)